ncbi:MAG: HWE histidine kinase domain-containing protein [Microvirga sp.]
MLSLNDLAPVLAFSDALGEALYALDRDWRVAAANEAARRWLGSDAIVGRLYWDLVPGARGTVVETAFRSAMAGRERVDVEAASSVHPGRFARGVVIPLADGLAVSFRDVTEEHSARTERQRQLAESEERLRLATEAASIGTWDVDATTGSRRWSARMRAILGIGEEVTADPKLFSALIDPRDRERVNALYRGAYAGDGEGRYATEFRIRRAGDGAKRWISTRGRVFFDGDGDGRALRAIGAIIDITKRKRAEEALRDSEEMFRSLAEALPQIVWIMRASDGRATYTNQRFLDYHGGPVGAELGERSANLHPDDRAEALATRDASVAAGLPFELDVRVRRHDGQYRWHRMSCVPLARDGEVRSYIGTATDIHDMRVAAEQEQLLIHELNHRVKNTLATVQSIAVQTFRGADGLERAVGGFEARLLALSRAHDVLTRENWEGADLHEIVARAIEPFAENGSERFSIRGPELRLKPKGALALAMALQELATNAAKYGALSSSAGQVQIRWTLERGLMHFCWTERGGPPVAPPLRRGFGSRLIERTLAQDLNGEVAVSFEREGVVCAVAAPLQ